MKNQHRPVLISSLKDVIEKRSTVNYSIAVCSSDNTGTKLITIINHWSRLYSIPDDIESLLVKYSKINEGYFRPYIMVDMVMVININQKIIVYYILVGELEIETLSDENIVKISAGHLHSLFLAANGVVYSCGNNFDGELQV